MGEQEKYSIADALPSVASFTQKASTNPYVGLSGSAVKADTPVLEDALHNVDLTIYDVTANLNKASRMGHALSGAVDALERLLAVRKVMKNTILAEKPISFPDEDDIPSE